MKKSRLFTAMLPVLLVLSLTGLSLTACASGAQKGETVPVPQLGAPNLLQQKLNLLPAVTIAGNSLQFQFGGETWIARLNGKDFSTGTIAFQNTEEGVILTLRQTHIWPGTAGEAAGNIANKIPGGGQVGGALNMAGKVAGALGPIRASGTIILEYKEGAPVPISVLSDSDAAEKIAVAQEAGFESGGDSSSDNISESSASVASNSRREPARTAANAKDNWISAQFGLIGGGVNYERMLNSKISLGINGVWYPIVLPSSESSFVGESSFLVNADFRFYPWGELFFVGTSLGCTVSGFDFKHSNAFVLNSDVFGLAITPEIGGKADVGNPGGLYVETGLRGSIIFAKDDVILGGITYFGMGCMF